LSLARAFVTTSRVSAEEFTRVIREGLPSGHETGFEVVSIELGNVVLRIQTGPGDLRPGNTIAGPVLFGFADLALYAVVMSAIGPVPLAVTTDATIHFLRRPTPGTLVARARLLKVGRSLVVGECEIAREGDDGGPFAHAVMSYSVPPAARGT
jgi:acyl-coenzyme A thioesterase PaaI-like protein